MDAVLKHLGLRSDFIVCHPGVIDDPLSRARRPPSTLHHPTPPLSLSPSLSPLPFQTHAHFSYFSMPALRRAALPAHLPRIFKH